VEGWEGGRLSALFDISCSMKRRFAIAIGFKGKHYLIVTEVCTNAITKEN
jgi:hypothetical protein